ncbi:hypothetical protein TcCL_ESM12008 [Trypanosoma cruzi]|uniref:Uncharacterized protein n=1 Tax=Trypanosoma cruzi (strain CL Brener) TaxID=353153 RepID=Q4DJX3_TRYCC|nr:hypothetical protein Tc00.1047053510879.100 [Trypanosoma cruzi]EAN92821.1 hypothetical protein Tc00.1047053510879.100 [Trypanosoma cruzi]RNC50926.1 hypothetical protein TcCL_ESM12008 [Trypanosoma cruzi]|eukprot:XP_814672.1 hypothetical protein [Trypanosoma cruzi strain CL Brener]
MPLQKPRVAAVVDGEDDSDDGELSHTANARRAPSVEELKQNVTLLYQRAAVQSSSQQATPPRNDPHVVELPPPPPAPSRKLQVRESDEGLSALQRQLTALQSVLRSSQKKFQVRDDATARRPLPIVTASQFKRPISEDFLHELRGCRLTQSAGDENTAHLKEGFSCHCENNLRSAYNRWRDILAEIHANALKRTSTIASKLDLEIKGQKQFLEEARQRIKGTILLTDTLSDTITCFTRHSSEHYGALQKKQKTST